MAIGCYVSSYLPGSFRGVPFESLDVESEHGRRAAEGEFPFGEVTGYQDMGRKIRRYSIKGRFLENTHILDAAAFIAACETPGPGVLVHPTRGVLTVGCSTLRVKDNPTEDQGVTTFEADFVEAPDWITGVGLELGLDLSTIIGAVSAVFLVAYQIDNLVFFYQDFGTAPARAVLRSIAEEIRRAVAISRTDHDRAWWVINDLDLLTDDERAIRDAPTILQAMKSGMNALSAFVPKSEKFASYKRIANAAASAPLSTSGDLARVQNATVTTARIMASVYMAQALLETPPATIAGAVLKASQVSGILQTEASVSAAYCDNELHHAITTIRAGIEQRVLSNAYTLPAVIEYDFGASTHALVAAYEILGDAKRVREIEEKNPSRAPWALGRLVVSGVS